MNQLLDAKMASFLNARQKMKASLNKSNQMNNKLTIKKGHFVIKLWHEEKNFDYQLNNDCRSNLSISL